MTDYGHDLRFGAFLTPLVARVDEVLAQAGTAEDLGLDLLTFQDHPYQPSFLDTWTLLSFVAARTQRIGLAPNVANVPLRHPAVLARSAAALDVLSHGRVELGLGAGHFLDAIVAMGGPDRPAGEHVDALEEAIAILRSLWSPGPPVRFEGRHYRLDGAEPGPVPAEPIPLWLGAYQPRMLRLTGRLADAWVPTLAYAGPERLGPMSQTIDAAAREAGRDPGEIRRLYNIAGTFAPQAGGFLQGPPATWAAQLTELVVEHGISTFILGPGRDAIGDLRRFAEEVAPAVREMVPQARRQRPAEAASPPAAVDPARHAAAEAQRLVAEEEPVSEVGRAGQQTLLAVHQHLRQELQQLREVIQQVAAGRRTAAAARSHLNQMAVRQNYWTLGSFCAAYCRVVATHHAIEDQHLFRELRQGDASLGPVLERLGQEHEVIAAILEEVDAALVAMVEDEDRLGEAQRAVDHLSEVLLAHLADEEDQLLEPIGRLAIHV